MQWRNRLRELRQDWVYLIHRDGWKTGLSQALKEVVSLPYRHLQFAIIARPLLSPLPDLKPKILLDIRPFEPTDLDFVRQQHLPSEANLCARRLQRDHRGLVACHNGQIAGYAWGCTDTSLEKVDIKLKPGDVLCTDAFTAPAFRRKRVQTALALARLRLFQDRGYQRAIAYIEIHNKPSLAVWRKVGSEVIDHVDFKRLGLWRRTQYY